MFNSSTVSKITRNVLYRKYRSQTFDALVGQTHITSILKNAVKKGAISHSYLFVGSRGTGKTSAARILAKAINCKAISKEGNPCNECESCISITSGTHLDIIEIDAASNRGIDQIRELKERIEYSPVEGNYKVYIIDEVHMLTTEAFNALLKTLEEPPSFVVFILATTDVHKLPATILSRCQRYDFRLGTNDQLREVLLQAANQEGISLDEDALDILVENAHGSFRDALSLLDVVVSSQTLDGDPKNVNATEVRNMLGIPDATMVFHLLDALATKNLVAALDLISELSSHGINFQQFVKYILLALREILVSQIRTSDFPEKYKLSAPISQRDILKMINLFIDADKKLKFTQVPELVLEVIVAELGGEPAPEAHREVVPKANEEAHKEPAPSPKANEKVRKEARKEEPMPVTKSVSVVSDTHELKESVVKMDKLDITIEAIKERWDNLLAGVQGVNGHLYGFLKSATIKDFTDGFLYINVPFQFHKDRIEAPKTRELLSTLFDSVYGCIIPLKCEVDSGIKIRKKVSADIILKSAPAQTQVSDDTKAAPSSEGKKKFFDPDKPRAIDKKIEEIFAGM